MAKKIGRRPVNVLNVILAWWCLKNSVLAEDANDGGCDKDSISDMIPLSSLTPNQFIKICPEQLDDHLKLGQPICGDGTSFGFFFQKPLQRKANEEKILIEFMGGGACWSEETCQMNEQQITFPEDLNDYIGYSCTEINYGLQEGEGGGGNNGYPINMLCAQSIGNTDFSTYNTIIVPYCTQDVHLGDSVMIYDDEMVMNHKGGHNTMAVLRWLFRNFKSPRHIALTGCSAGATALPIVYDLIRKHYSGIGKRKVQISLIADSPVYLTPSYFLRYKFSNWGPGNMMAKVGFNYNRWKYANDYPTRNWDHILRRGNKKDRWGVVMHTKDPVALMYYQYMSGQDEDDDSNRRQLGGEDNGEYEYFFSEFTDSIETVQSKHKNIETYFLEGEGHCSFGLYYPLTEDGEYFEEWASTIFQEQNIGPNLTALRLCLLSLSFGLFFFVGAYHAGHRREISLNLDDGGLFDEETRMKARKSLRPILGSCVKCSSFAATFPITAAYTLVISIYFWTMIISQAFVHPLNNPSLGPSAIALSNFGINNPSLTLYKSQGVRLFTSNLLCSGILTYLIVVHFLWHSVRPLEGLMCNNLHFMLISAIISLGSNLVYTIFGNGATCSSVSLVIGLSTVYLQVRRQMEEPTKYLGFSIFFLTLIVCLVFPFNSWIIIFCAIIIGFLLVAMSIKVQTEEPLNMQEDGVAISSAAVNPVKVNINTLAGAVVPILLMIIISMIRVPNELYLQPYYTGCDLRYACGEDIANLANSYAFRRRKRERLLQEENYDDMCAQLCIPHLVSRVAVYGAKRIFGLYLVDGQCEGNGYSTHMADKTFNFFLNYSFDVEIFTQSKEEEDNEKQHESEDDR